MRILQRRSATSLVVIMAGIVLLGLSQFSWITFQYSDVLGLSAAKASGSTVSPQVAACAVVVIAAGLLLTLAGRVLQRVALFVGGIAGFLAVWSIAAFLIEDERLEILAAATLPGSAVLTSEVRTTVWPWFAGVVALLILLWCSLALWKAPVWVRKSARYESHSTASNVTNQTAQARVDWDLISDGVDPSDGPRDEPRDEPSERS